MTLLSIIEDVADSIGLNKPTSVIGNTDQQVKTLLAMAQLEGKDLAKRDDWSSMQKLVSHTTLSTEEQGELETIAPGFDYLITHTMWDQSIDRPVNGSLTPQKWSQLQANNILSPYAEFRIRDKKLFLYPVPTTGSTLAFEYMSKNWCESSAGTGQQRWAADDDVGILDEDLMTLGIIWRYKRAKNFDYSEEFRTYESRVSHAIGHDGDAQTISMDSDRVRINADPTIPDGDWLQ